jgi:hypothetical protein
MILVFLILAGVLIWALCKTDTFSRKSKSGGDDLERLRREWESQGPQEPAQGSGAADQSDLERIRRQVWEDKKRREASEMAKRAAEKETEEQDALAFQKALEDKFLASSTTRRIIDAIGDGTGRLPEEITVYNDRVTGRTNGRMREFDFAVNRVPFLDKMYTMEGDVLKTAHNPKEALARAIDRILGGQYNIEHSSPSHVLLRLKPTTPW